MFMNPGDSWRRGRRLYSQQLTESLCEKRHVHLLHAEATQMLRDFCLNPEGLMAHPKRYSNSIIMSIGVFLAQPHHFSQSITNMFR